MFIDIAGKIKETITKTPGLTAKDIAEINGFKPTSVKVILNRMAKRNIVTRTKTPRAEKTKTGPQNLYTYTMAQVESENANTQN